MKTDECSEEGLLRDWEMMIQWLVVRVTTVAM